MYEPSPYFRLQKEYIQQEADRYYILSAKYYVLEPSDIIQPYNQQIANKAKWGTEAFKRLMDYVSEYSTEATFVITAGRDYSDTLVLLLNNHGYKVRQPVDGLKFGPTLSRLKELVDD